MQVDVLLKKSVHPVQDAADSGHMIVSFPDTALHDGKQTESGMERGMVGITFCMNFLAGRHRRLTDSG